MHVNPSGFYPALSTHVQKGVDLHGNFPNIPAFLNQLSERVAKLGEAVAAAAEPLTDKDVAYRIHQVAAVSLKALCNFDMMPSNAKPPPALSHPPDPAEPATEAAPA